MNNGATTVVGEPISAAGRVTQVLVDRISRVVLGHDEEVRLVVAALLARAHVLLEDAPGTGKTLLARTVATVIGGEHRRVQATPDLLPSDVTGTSIFQPDTADWVFRPGPVFTNVLVIDEINRASPRTQAALLEPMEERQVTVDGRSRPLPDPFLLIATQNPLGDAGTFPLPASQLDRFGLILSLGRPSREAERAVLAGRGGFPALARTDPVIGVEHYRALAVAATEQHVSDGVADHVLDIADALWQAPRTVTGPSARASLGVLRIARALALVNGRDYVTPGDVRAVAGPALAHRVVIEGLVDLAAARRHVEDVVACVPPPPPG